MDAFGGGGLGDGGFGAGIGQVRTVAVDVYTSAYRVSGEVETRFSRVTEILNQLTGAHLQVLRATLSEHDDPTSTVAAPSALVAVEEILVMVAPDLGGPPGEMRIPKRPVLAHLALRRCGSPARSMSRSAAGRSTGSSTAPTGSSR